MLRRLLFFFLMPALCSVTSAQEPMSLLAAAHAKSDIFSQGPFFMLASYRATDDPKFKGQYGLIWISKDQWREEITDPTGNSIRIGKGNTVWSMRTSPKPTALAQDLRWLFGFRSRLALRPEITLEKVKSQKRGGVSLKCVQFRYSDTKDQVCFDDANHFVSSKWEEYLDYRTVGNAEFPFRLGSKRFYREVQVTVEKVELNPSVKPEFFATDARFQSTPDCHASQYPLTLRKTPPVYPYSAKAARVQGRVTAEVSLTETGAVKDVQLIHGHPMLGRETLEALKNWTFAPARCNGTPIPSGMIIEVTYTLSGESFPPSPPRL
jgi:TonB family protein